MIAAVAGIKVRLIHIPGPQGVRGRNSDNKLLREVLEWEPEISLEDGLAKTYAWIEAQVASRLNAVNLANAVGVANAQL
jgi:nucleoside-diphosphate-sugar epimerase